MSNYTLVFWFCLIISSIFQSVIVNKETASTMAVVWFVLAAIVNFFLDKK